jgi:hypothetical protein
VSSVIDITDTRDVSLSMEEKPFIKGGSATRKA